MREKLRDPVHVENDLWGMRGKRNLKKENNKTRVSENGPKK